MADRHSRAAVLSSRSRQNGRAVLTGVDPRTCKVSSPDFDAPDWKAA